MILIYHKDRQFSYKRARNEGLHNDIGDECEDNIKITRESINIDRITITSQYIV